MQYAGGLATEMAEAWKRNWLVDTIIPAQFYYQTVCDEKLVDLHADY